MTLGSSPRSGSRCRLTIKSNAQVRSLPDASDDFSERRRPEGRVGSESVLETELTPSLQTGLVDTLWKIEDLSDAVMGIPATAS